MHTDNLLMLICAIQLVLLFVLIYRSFSLKSDDKDVIQSLRRELDDQMQANRKEISQGLVQQFSLVFDTLRATSKEQREALGAFELSFKSSVGEFNALQKEKFQDLIQKQERMLSITDEKLEKMRETVDEKLQKTLEARIGQSFELVNKQLMAVQKGLGEMQNLAVGVGDLKKVLNNVKTRGILGEYQLQAILENVLAPEQYEYNVQVKQGATERVEYAIKMPGSGQDERVYLPIDAKFPQETYYRLLDAYELGDKLLVDAAKADLRKAVKKAAADIHHKYIHPPFTTDFAVLFLPMESLYAEVIREGDLAQQLQRDFKVILVGPTTMAAILNSLQMGFRTLAIQQRSGEVWKVLGAVKTEFNKFGDLISKAQKKINEANSDLDQLVGTRTRVIQRRLKDIEELPESEGSQFLDKP
ncbi:DNA recombination protein RmuC [Belliella kenyensis]|uniref:DNA recombination protein RmuC n=1 Tax=Belliella kenyensis TaxID=1472724 RepID=A0ABV8EKL4_9BACT|nr:DNA recombination protein RmuC [Belliella kenyensis]MCH7400450.1 DNA recombination protein RmuC [Belliella kenyensis]MDN3604534.1 DNA recombination protein RmuC [Belliella kenyensis]